MHYWSVCDVNEWLQTALDTRSKYVRHSVDPRFKSRVLSPKSADVGLVDNDNVFTIPSALLDDTLHDIVQRMGAAVAPRPGGLPPCLTVVMRAFPFAHAPDIGVLIDPSLPPADFWMLHNRACVAVATAMSLLKLRLDKRVDAKPRGGRGAGRGGGRAKTEGKAEGKAAGEHDGNGEGKRSGVIVQGRAGMRFVETPFLPHAPTLQLVISPVYLTHHRPTFQRGNGEWANFELFRMREACGSRPDKLGLDVVIYHSDDQELHRLYPELGAHTERTAMPGLTKWTHSHMLQEMHIALDSEATGYMGYKWARLRDHDAGEGQAVGEGGATPAAGSAS